MTINFESENEFQFKIRILSTSMLYLDEVSFLVQEATNLLHFNCIELLKLNIILELLAPSTYCRVVYQLEQG